MPLNPVFLRRIAGDKKKVAASVSLLLDTYTGAAAAYSLRKLRTAYSGSAIRVRESGGDTEADIGFDGNDLDEAALLSHCGANDGFVVTWYDQSQTGIGNASQATAATQPRIVNAGSVTKINGKPAIEYLSGGSSLVVSNVEQGDIFGASVENTLLSVMQQGGSEATNLVAHMGSRSSGDRYWNGLSWSDTLYYDAGNPSTRRVSTSQPAGWDDAQHIVVNQSDGDNAQIRVDGAQEVTGEVSGSVSIPTGGLGIGSQDNESEPLLGFLQEVVIWNSNSPDPGGVETDVNGYYNVY